MSKFINLEKLKSLYNKIEKCSEKARNELNRNLTLTEKILYSHLYQDINVGEFTKGESDGVFAPDRVVMQDATAQMAVLQFISTQVNKVMTPTSIHCDHLLRAINGGASDLENAKNVNKEVYNFLGSAAKKYGMDFWEPGSGIIHQIVLENYAFPGGMIIGTDSHTPTAGGLGMLAIGVGGADAVDVMTAQPWQLKIPKIIGVKLTGKLEGWTSPKDVILYLLGQLSSKGGTGKIVEYFGSGVETLSCTGKATITNMGAELGATTSVFPYDASMQNYLDATDRSDVRNIADEYQHLFKADPEVLENPENYYDEIIEINLSELEPAWTGPHATDAYHPISTLESVKNELDLPDEVSACLIGSCTNSSYEDLNRAAKIAEDAYNKGLRLKAKLLISPGSNQIAATMQQEGFTEIFEKIGGVILTNSCGPCIGQWDRKDKQGEKNVIITTFNRNFKKRNDGQEVTNAFLASAEIVIAAAFSGSMTFNPSTDKLLNENGEEVSLSVFEVDDLPSQGFASAPLDYIPPAENGDNLQVEVDPNSERIQLLEPFNEWNLEQDFNNLVVLVKADGKCTTDHISPAGPWLKFRGHLDNISKNMYSGAVNAFSGEIGKGKNIFKGNVDEYNQVAREYKKDGQGWIVIGDENYGEGSSREHAAMEPRFLGCRSVIAKSFARIAETNLKKQGILPLWLKNPADYDKFKEESRVEILNLDKLGASKEVQIKIDNETIIATHTLSDEHIKWFYAGSALNKVGKELRNIN